MKASREELASLYVLDQLDARERADFLALRQRDPELDRLVRELERTLAARIQALPHPAPSPATWARLEERLDRLTSETAVAPGRRHAFAWGLLGGLAALLIAGVGLLGYRWLRPASADSARPVVIIAGLVADHSSLARVAIPAATNDADARFIQLARLAERYWSNPETLPVTWAAGSRRAGRAYALFDPDSNQGFVAVQGVPVLQPLQRYHLWAVDRSTGETRDAGVLPLEAATGGLFFFSMPSTAGVEVTRMNFFITAEETEAATPSSSRPRGPVVLGQKPTY